MGELILQADRDLFLFINGHHNTWWDGIMYFASAKLSWIPFYLALLAILFWKQGKKTWLFLLFIALTIALADLSSVYLFKNVVQRLRPCHDPLLEGLVHLVRGHCGGLYGFISSHAANSFSLAMILSLFYRNKWWALVLFAWAAFVSYSRIYLGVHYPGDVMAGASWGVLCGWGIYTLYMWIQKKIAEGKDSKQK